MSKARREVCPRDLLPEDIESIEIEIAGGTEQAVSQARQGV
jgi:hypothetical protein